MNDQIVKALVDLGLILIPIVLGLVGKVLLNLWEKQTGGKYDRLAAIAVHWAEDQAEKGGKLDAASQKMVELSGGKLKLDDAKVLVAATYSALTKALDPLSLPAAPAQK